MQTEIPKVVEKLSGGKPLGIEQLLEYLAALKEGARAQLDNWAKGAAVLHRYNKGEIVCEEGDFGSTAFFIISGVVDIFIHNPLSHLRTKPAIGIFGRSVARMKSFLTDDKTAPRPERGTRQFIGIDDVDLPIKKPLAQLGPGNSHEMTCRTYQPRSATVCALFFGGAIEVQTMLLRTGELRSLKGASYSLTWAMLNWSKAIRISRYARRLDPAWMIAS